jgi:rRNA-processing protein Efg1
LSKRWQNDIKWCGSLVTTRLDVVDIERQKATRRLRHAKKVNKDTSTGETQEEVDKFTLDLYYTTHFPLTEKYIALYPKEGIESQDVLDKRERIRQNLREEMLNGKKKISGSNNVRLGSRKRPERGATNAERRGSNLGEDIEATAESSEEDEFLDMGHKKR